MCQDESDRAGHHRRRGAGNRHSRLHGAGADALAWLGEQGLEQLGTQFRIPLFNHFYRQR